MEVSQKKIGNAFQSWQPWLLLGLFWIIFFAIRLTGPSNLMDHDQQHPSAYVLDAVNNGNWICQHDENGDITSKPPVWAWLSGLLTLLWGRINLFTLYLPGAAAAFGVMAILFVWGKKYFGFRAAMFAAIALVLNSCGSKWMGLARTDGVFAFTVTAAAFFAWRAWNQGGGWTWFWVAAAISTLTKGPLGLVLAAGGLLACWWGRKSAERLPLKGSHLLGIVLFLLICLGWFWLAYLQEGRPLIDKMLGKELLGHVADAKKNKIPGTLIWQPPLFYLGNVAPWSFVAYFGFWRIWKRPEQNHVERRIEQFLFCWFAVGLAIFSIAPHQRPDLLWPIMPPGALIAGRELARLTARFKPVHVRYATITTVLIGLITFYFFYNIVRGREPLVKKTAEVKQLAATVEREGGVEFPITYVDAPMVLQASLNTLRPEISANRAVELLRGTEAAFVAVRDIATLTNAMQTNVFPLFTLLPEPQNLELSPARIVSNRPDFSLTNGFAFCFGSIYVRVHGAKLLLATQREFRFALTGPAEIVVKNESDNPKKVSTSIEVDGKNFVHERVLAAREAWMLPIE
jgi:4-amino-4-deoxy-L-arabinose transferase-like glycosyltransferase